MSDVAEILDIVVQEVEEGRRAALCVIVAARGSTPQGPGAMLAVTEHGGAAGTIGGGQVEAEIRELALRLIPLNQSEVHSVSLDNEASAVEGMICGGSVTAAIRIFASPREAGPAGAAAELLRAGQAAALTVTVTTADGPAEYRVFIEAPPRLTIAGGGHLGRALAMLTPPLGFRVKVIDDRAEYADVTRFPPPIQRVVGDIPSTLREERLGADSYIVIVTRGHQCDEAALAAVIDSPAHYIGMVGSKRKIKTIYDNLRRGGVTEEQLARVHAPIGLAIRAVSPEEIAISIAAEMIAVRRENRRQIIEGPFPAE